MTPNHIEYKAHEFTVGGEVFHVSNQKATLNSSVRDPLYRTVIEIRVDDEVGKPASSSRTNYKVPQLGLGVKLLTSVVVGLFADFIACVTHECNVRDAHGQ